MIIKAVSHTRVHYGSFLDYVLDEEKQIDPESQWRIVENIDCVPTDKKGLERAYLKNARLKPKRKNGVVMYHELISASPNSGATPEIMYDLTLQYLKLRNTKNGLAVASMHADKNHLHVHIMLSGNEQGGERSTALSRKEFY